MIIDDYGYSVIMVSDFMNNCYQEFQVPWYSHYIPIALRQFNTTMENHHD